MKDFKKRLSWRIGRTYSNGNNYCFVVGTNGSYNLDNAPGVSIILMAVWFLHQLQPGSKKRNDI